VVQHASLFLCQHHDTSGSVGKPFEHVCSSLRSAAMLLADQLDALRPL
jgi:hypothetical protein